MHHRYIVISERHACRDCVLPIMLDAELCTTCPGERVLVLSSDVLESLLPSQSHTPFESKSSTFFSSQVRVESWLGRVESQEMSSHFDTLVCKLESMSIHTKFHNFSMQ